MQTFIVFLRGINVSGQKKMKMAKLKEILSENGFQNVQTYIQSGNLILSTKWDKETVAQKIKDIITDNFGFEVPILVLTAEVVNQMLEACPYAKLEDKKRYFTLLYEQADAKMVADFEALSYENEDFSVTENCVYLYCKNGAGKAKLSNNVIEQKLKVTATTRNLNTMRKMLELTKKS
ncbi:DUF1697 domain-containing protein [uncultured Croceitalea sp.]|uniref:DUF1697 domain-containing protein n=1 Tax=uncultured Croceitalea sp. TaxID=1798908 RepID=UPI00330674E9